MGRGSGATSGAPGSNYVELTIDNAVQTLTVLVEQAVITNKEKKPDPYVLLNLGRHQERTSNLKNTNTPVWQQTFTLPVENPSDYLQVKVKDKDLNRDDLMFEDVLAVNQIPQGRSKHYLGPHPPAHAQQPQQPQYQPQQQQQYQPQQPPGWVSKLNNVYVPAYAVLGGPTPYYNKDFTYAHTMPTSPRSGFNEHPSVWNRGEPGGPRPQSPGGLDSSFGSNGSNPNEGYYQQQEYDYGYQQPQPTPHATVPGYGPGGTDQGGYNPLQQGYPDYQQYEQYQQQYQQQQYQQGQYQQGQYQQPQYQGQGSYAGYMGQY